jgi:hypothetical protein
MAGVGNNPGHFGLTGIPGQNHYMLNELNTPIGKQTVGLLLYHRENCRRYRQGECFCADFDDSIHANRLVINDYKKKAPGERQRSEAGRRLLNGDVQEGEDQEEEGEEEEQLREEAGE